METLSLQECLERIQSDVAASSYQGLECLKYWFQDARNLARAEAEAELYYVVVKVLLNYVRRQVVGLVKPVGRKSTFRIDGVVLLAQVVRLACRGVGGRRTGPPKLARIHRKLWEHADEVFRCEAVASRQQTVLSYYCRLVKELAECANVGYLSELRGDLFRRLLRQLLQIPAPDVQSSAWEAATLLFRHLDSDPSSEIPWLCDRAMVVLPSGGQPAAACLAAACLRCPLVFRDWLFEEGKANTLGEAALSAWSLKTSEGLDFVLRLALGFAAPLQHKHTAGLLPLVAETLEALARSEMISADFRVARLAELLAALLLHAEPSIKAAGERLCLQLEQRCLPWALCVVRLCEGHAAMLFGDRHGGECENGDVMLMIFDALLRQFAKAVRLTHQELIAVHYALAALLTARAWARIWPAGTRLATLQVPLSALCGDASAASLAAPGLVGALPTATVDTAPEWVDRLCGLAKEVLPNAAIPLVPRGLHHLLAAILLTAPPSAIEGGAQQFLLQLAASRRGKPAKLSIPVRSCILAALRRYQPDATLQGELAQGMASESIDTRISFLRLLALDGHWFALTSPSPQIVPISHDADEDDRFCAHVPLDDANSTGSVGGDNDGSAPLLCEWYNYRCASLLRQVEIQASSATLDRSTGSSGAGNSSSPNVSGVSDDLRFHHAVDAATFGARAAAWRLGHADIVNNLPPAPDSPWPHDSHSGVALLGQAVDAFLEQSKEFVKAAVALKAAEADVAPPGEDAPGPGLVSVGEAAVALLPTMGVVLRLPHGSKKQWTSVFQECLLHVLKIACKMIAQADTRQHVAPLFEAILDLLNAGLSQRGGAADVLDLPEAATHAALLVEAIHDAWRAPAGAALGSTGNEADARAAGGRPSERTHPDLFEARCMGATNVGTRHQAHAIPRSLSLRLALALVCRWPGAVTGEGNKAANADCLLQLLARIARSEPDVAMPMLRLVTLELAAGNVHRSLGVVDVVAQAWSGVSDPVALRDLEDMLLCALRLTAVVERSGFDATKVLRHFWSVSGRGEGRLVALVKRWRLEPNCLSPRGKLMLAVLCIRTLRLLKGLQGFESVVDLVADCCSSTVCDLILKDESCEVRLAVGAECTKPLFELFDDALVYEDFAQSWAPLVGGNGGNSATSAEIATVQVMTAICAVDCYACRVVPELCALRPGLSTVVRFALGALDEALLGTRGKGGTSRLALAMRACVFAVHLRGRRRLADMDLGSIALRLPSRQPRKPLGSHVAAAVAALALSEELTQLPDLAIACGYTKANEEEFEELLFVPLAGTILPLHRSMETLRTRYGPNVAMAKCKKACHRILAFSLQLPFLTASMPRPIDAQAISTAFSELGQQTPWSNFKAFVSKHFHFLLAQLDRTLHAWARWSPVVAIDLLRNFVMWVGPLRGARLRLLLPTLQRHGLALPLAHRQELCTIIEVVVSSSAEALAPLASHQDESLRELLAAVEREWAERSGDAGARSAIADSVLSKRSPSLAAIVAVLRGLRKSDRGAPDGDFKNATEWFWLQIDAMLPRLRQEARSMLEEELRAGEMDAGGARLAKRPRRSESSCGITAALRPLAPPDPKLSWGPLPAPDLGALAQCLAEADGESGNDGVAIARVLRLLAQPTLVAQLRREGALAQKVAQGLSKISPAIVSQLGDEVEGDVLEMALPAVAQQDSQSYSQGNSSSRHARSTSTQGIDEFLCCGAFLGASVLQVHSSGVVRHFALAALQQLLRQRQVSEGAQKLLGQILDPGHLCLQDLAELQPAEMPTKKPEGIDASGTSASAWTSFAESGRGEQSFSVWVRTLCSNMLVLGSKVWDPPAAEMLLACAPLAQSVDWFAERMLVLAILKAAVHKGSGQQLARAISSLLCQDSVKTAQAQCIMRGLQYVRRYQTGKLRRAVPHFPTDNEDQFWAELDLYAVADCASRAGCAREGLLYLELHLAREQPDQAIDQTLLKPGAERVSVDELFKAPTKEVQLVHSLAKQLPDDELLYGVSQWCHATSRLVRAELGHDHLLELQLHNGLREAELHASSGTSTGASDTQVGLDSALARLGLHTVFAGSSLNECADAAVWERRMEGLWRLRQWNDSGPTASSAAPAPATAGFHAQMHGALASLAAPSEVQPQLRMPGAATDLASTTLAGLVADVAAGLHVHSLEQLRVGAVRLQMLGSVFGAIEAARNDARGGANQTAAMSALAARWSAMAGAALSAPHFLLTEPLSALRATLLALAAPPLVELRYLTTLAAQAREAMQVHRALGLLEQAHHVSHGAPRPDLLRLRWEQARCFWELRKEQESLGIARAVAAECRKVPASRAAATRAPAQDPWMARALSDTGLWLSVSRLEASDVIRQEFMDPAVSMAPLDAQPRRQLAEFLDARLGEELARQNSLEHAISCQLRRRTHAELEAHQRELQALERTPAGRETEIRMLREHIRSAERICEQDRQQEAAERERLKSLALHCVQGMGRCLEISPPRPGTSGKLGEEAQAKGQSLTSVACRFLSLWFDYSREYPEVTNAVKELIPRLSIGLLSPFLYQLASRLGTQDGAFKQTLEDLLLRIAARGAHNLWALLLLKNGDQVPKGMRSADKFVADKEKIAAAKRVIERLRPNQAVRPVLEATEVLSRFYMNIAFFEVDKKNREVRIKVSTLEGYRDVRKVLQQVPVPTAAPPPEGGPPAPGIAGFDDTFGVAKQGLSAPKMLGLTDTAGRAHAQIVKGMDDLRQDAVMQQLFRLLNDVFGENPKSRQAGLRLRTFQVVPLSPCAGVMECVTDAVTLGELLTGNQAPAEGAHARYRPQDWSHLQARKRMADAREAFNAGESGALEKAYRDVCGRFRPVMHLVFLERFASPLDWHHARQNYARSTAVSSMVGYIVGIGDRHPNNILFDQRTGELVHIDFGITFDQGRALRVPELTPCRLTRDVVDGLGCLGTCGLFRRCCETALGVLREGSALVNAVAEVFVHDPVYLWSLTPRKARQQDSGAQGAGRQGAPEPLALGLEVAGAGAGADGNEMAKRALLTVKSKLRGEHGVAAAALGVPAHVGWIIREAMDPNNLARMYFGWSQWL